MTNVSKNPAKSQPNGRFFYARPPSMPPADGHCCEAMLLTAMNRLLHDVAHYLHRQP